MTGDIELLRRYVAHRSEEAFAELVRRHLKLVYFAALRRTADPHLAEDVTQYVFTTFAREAASLSRHPILTGWLYTTTRFAASKLLRSERRRRGREMEAHLMHESSFSVPGAAEWDRLRPVIDVALDELNDRDREAILLRFFEGWSYGEVAEKLSLSEDAVRMRVERALEKLRIQLARRGVTSTANALGLVLASQPALAVPVELASTVIGSALTSAATTMPAWGAIQLMGTTKFVTGAAGLALILAIGFTVHEFRVRQDARDAVAMTGWKADALSARLAEVQKRAATAENNLANLERAVAEARTTEATDRARAAEAAARARDPVEVGKEFLATHPEAEKLVADYSRVWLTGIYHLLFDALRLTPAQIQQFIELRLQLDGGISWNTAQQAPAARFNIGELSRDEVDRELRTLLGEAGYQQFQEFDRSRGARSMAEQVARVVYSSETPLSAGQAARLTEIVARNSPDYRSGRAMTMANFDWGNATDEARAVLSEAQLAAFTSLRTPAERSFRSAMNQAVNQAMQQARQEADIPPNF